MDLWLIMCILTGALFSVSFAQTRQFYFVSTELNWTDAQSFCRREYSDLATIENTDDVDAVLNTTSNYTGKVWIGLHDDLENSWKWSLNDSSFYVEGDQTFKNWQLNQPDNLNGQQYCVGFQSGNSSRGNWDDRECSEEHGFVCYNGTVKGFSSFVVVDTRLNWTEAQRYCRNNFVDLASIRNQIENDLINDLANGSFVWIGLYRHKVWSDGSNSVFEDWNENQPDHGDQKCIAASFSDSGRWSDEFCSQSLPFICYGSAFLNAGFILISQNETSITLQWNKGSSNDSFVLQFNGKEINISAPDGDGPITYTVSSLTAGTKYTFTLLFGSSLTRVNITAVTAPVNVEYFKVLGKSDTSITLQWSNVSSNSYILKINSEFRSLNGSGNGPVTYTVESLNAATEYIFTVFTVFENTTSSGVQLRVVTAPQNVETFTIVKKTDRSVTLQWSKVSFTSYVLQYNQGWVNISASDGDGPITYTVSSLNASTSYTFTLFCVFENARSSGVQLQASTDPPYFPCGQTFCPPDQDCVFINGMAQCGEACEHYTELNDDGLSEYNINGNRNCYRKYYSTKAWYRMFVGQTSAQIPETCVQDSRCGSYYHYQMTEPHPTQYSQTVTRSLCYNYGSSCYCYSPQSIKVKLCFGDFFVYELQRLPGCYLSYCAVPKHSFRAAGQDETSITLRWDKVNNSVSFVLLFNGTETNISAPAADDSVTYTVSSLTAATKYTFTLFSVFENVTSSGISIDAVTAPPNAEMFSITEKKDTSVTLQWSKLKYSGYVLSYYDYLDKFIAASDPDGPVIFTVSSLYSAYKYTFTLFSVFENARSSGVQLTVVTDHRHVRCGETFCAPDLNCFIKDGSAQCVDPCEHHTVLNERSSVNRYCDDNIVPGGWYSFFLGGTRARITETCEDTCPTTSHYLKLAEPHPTEYNQSVSLPVCYSYNGLCCYYIEFFTKAKLCYGNFYVYKLFDQRACYDPYCTVPHHQRFRVSGQSETSITLQWDNLNNNATFILEFNGTETNISGTNGDGTISYTITSLTAGTKYTFTLFSVVQNDRSSGQQLTAFTAPQNAKSFKASTQNESSITLQWDKVNNNVSFVLQFNGTETNIRAPAGDGVVNHTVSSLTARTKYTFTLFSVFENVRSSGVNITAATGSNHVVGLDMEFWSVGVMTEAEMQRTIEELLQRYGLSPNSLSIKVKHVQP